MGILKSCILYYCSSKALTNLRKKPNNPQVQNQWSSTGFPKLLFDRNHLDTVAGFHVPPKFCDVSLKKRFSVRISH